MFQEPLDQHYLTMSETELGKRIAEVKEKLGSRLVILGHHYQRESVINFADFRGDSLELSKRAAEQKDADYIVFCGVHFMAESADILTSAKQRVFLPDMTAGCPMAEMAALDQVEQGWDVLAKMIPEKRIIPICYVNSTAAIKAFCGSHDGMCCTSSNCQAVFESVWKQYPEAVIFFLPDQHLARNTGFGMGVALDAMVLYDPYDENGGLFPRDLAEAKLVLWDGFCSVHQRFTAEQIAQAQIDDPDVQTIVHPECCFEVAQQADIIGSTAAIIKAIEASAAGTHWAVGTERNLVERLAKQMAPRGVQVKSLSDTPCQCETMFRIDLPHLAWVLDHIAAYDAEPTAGVLKNQVVVDEAQQEQARIALQRMLDVTA